jgi:hypothetical protein
MVFILSTLSTTRKHFGKVLTALWHIVGQVDNLDGSNKSLAYNIALMEIYKYVVFIE